MRFWGDLYKSDPKYDKVGVQPMVQKKPICEQMNFHRMPGYLDMSHHLIQQLTKKNLDARRKEDCFFLNIYLPYKGEYSSLFAE